MYDIENQLDYNQTKPSTQSNAHSTITYLKTKISDLPYKNHFLIDIIGTTLLIKNFKYTLRSGIYEFLNHYKQRGTILSLQSDALSLKNPKKEYKITKEKLSEIKNIFRNINKNINLDWLDLFDNVYDKSWQKAIKNPYEIKHISQRYKFYYPLKIKDYKKMSSTTNISLEDTVVIGDEPDTLMAKITKISYFPIKSEEYLDFKNLIK